MMLAFQVFKDHWNEYTRHTETEIRTSEKVTYQGSLWEYEREDVKSKHRQVWVPTAGPPR